LGAVEAGLGAGAFVGAVAGESDGKLDRRDR
jgi:hypothetical protein